MTEVSEVDRRSRELRELLSIIMEGGVRQIREIVGIFLNMNGIYFANDTTFVDLVS